MDCIINQEMSSNIPMNYIYPIISSSNTQIFLKLIYMTLPAFHTFFYFKSETLEKIFLFFFFENKMLLYVTDIINTIFKNVSVIIQTIAGLYFEF